MDYLLSWYSPYVSLTRGPFKLFKYKMKMKIHSFFRLVAQRGFRGVTNIMKKCIWPPPFPYQISQHEPACHDIEAVPWVSIFLRCIDTSPAAQRVSLDPVMSGVAGVCTLPQNIKYKLFTPDNIGCGTLLVCYPRNYQYTSHYRL